MLKIILKTSFFYYIMTIVLLLLSINFNKLHALRLGYLRQYIDSPMAQEKILLYDYGAHVQPQNASYWSTLAVNDYLYGDYTDAIKAIKKAKSI